MKLKTKIILAVVAVIIIGIIVSIICLRNTTTMRAESEDGKWSAYAVREYENPEGTWCGYLFYNGNESGDIGEVKIIMDFGEDEKETEETYTMDYDPSFLEFFAVRNHNDEVYSYMALCPEKPSQLELQVFWKEKGERKNTRLVLE